VGAVHRFDWRTGEVSTAEHARAPGVLIAETIGDQRRPLLRSGARSVPAGAK
jgi:hypothetical protein